MPTRRHWRHEELVDAFAEQYAIEAGAVYRGAGFLFLRDQFCHRAKWICTKDQAASTAATGPASETKADPDARTNRILSRPHQLESNRRACFSHRRAGTAGTRFTAE